MCLAILTTATLVVAMLVSSWILRVTSPERVRARYFRRRRADLRRALGRRP